MESWIEIDLKEKYCKNFKDTARMYFFLLLKRKLLSKDPSLFSLSGIEISSSVDKTWWDENAQASSWKCKSNIKLETFSSCDVEYKNWNRCLKIIAGVSCVSHISRTPHILIFCFGSKQTRDMSFTQRP